MELFDQKGHLTEDALSALTRGEVLSELHRLEVSEHLAYCDDCLLRYTAHLTDDVLLTPAQSCQKTLWQKIRLRTLRIVTSRYATAAAGVALMVAVLWGSAGLSHVTLPRPPAELAAVSQQLQDWPSQWSDSLDGVFSQVTAFFGQRGDTTPEGGAHP